MQNTLQRLGFIGTTGGKHDVSGIAQHGRRKGNTKRVKLFDPRGSHEPLAFVYCSRARKQRGSMAVGAHAQENQVKAWQRVSHKMKGGPQRRFILVRRLLGLFLGAHTINIGGWNGGFGEHGFVRHAVITVVMIRWYVALISPEEVDLLPRDPVTVGGADQQGISGFRRAPASQRHSKASPRNAA